MDKLDLLRSLAGPMATIIAATVAGTIAVLISFSQRDIAFQQKEIAKEKLRLDLFDKRYKVYSSLFDLYDALIGWKATEADKAAFRHFFLSSKEAHFLFGEDVRSIVEEILRASTQVKGIKENLGSYKSDPKFFNEQFALMNEILLSRFDKMLKQLTEACQPYIGFQQSGMVNAAPNTLKRRGYVFRSPPTPQ